MRRWPLTPRDWADVPPPAADGDPWVCQPIATTPRAMRGVLVGLAAVAVLAVVVGLLVVWRVL
jgi:hypothetical protein